MKNPNGKPVGLMAAGSTAHMSILHQESEKQKKENLLGDTPIDDKASAVEMSHDGVPMKHDGVPMKHDGVPMKDPGSAMPMDYKGMSMKHDGVPMKYDSPTPMHGPFHAGHDDDDSPAMFTGMSGGSALPELEMIKVNGKMVPKYAADGKGKNDLLKKKK